MSLNIELRSATLADTGALQESVWPERSFTTVRELLERAEELERRGRGDGLAAVSTSPRARVVPFGFFKLGPWACESSDLSGAAKLCRTGIAITMSLTANEHGPMLITS